jgi:hypothetical protein
MFRLTKSFICQYAGMQYDGDTARAQKILSDLPTYVPGASPVTTYEVAGFFYWQGDKDRCKFIFCSACSSVSIAYLIFTFSLSQTMRR